MTRRATWAALGALLVVVDQVDAGIAAIELPDRQILYVPLTMLPRGVGEGDRLRLELAAENERQPGRKPHSKKRRDHEHPDPP